jgi:hypothetical protein
MLRLGRGWSADELSREYEKTGIGSLSRASIAKIESDRRLIKASEVVGVARTFGLELADLLAPDGPKVLLSYAEDMRQEGQEIATWLSVAGFNVLFSRKPSPNCEIPPSVQPHAINGVDAFVVLLSSGYLSSPWCREELDLAVRRKRQIQAAGPALEFIYAMRITEEYQLEVSDVQSYSTADLTLISRWDGSAWHKEVTLSKLGSKIILGSRGSSISRDSR